MTKSRTMWVAAATSMLGAAIAGMPLVEAAVSKTTYGVTLFVLGIVFAGLRKVTTKPLGER